MFRALVLFLGGVLLTQFIFGSEGRCAPVYTPGPDSFEHAGVPKGEVTKYSLTNSFIFPGTHRNYWVYVPRQYDPAHPACLYVNQDGIQFKAPVVFDNLIAQHAMPVTIGVFVMPGEVPAKTPGGVARNNRSYEYDGVGSNYARFLLKEILPKVEGSKTSDGRVIHLSANPNDRGIGGSSSGAICAFTVAWQRPDSFRRVFSAIGTYVDLRGGNEYPAMIRKTEVKPLRVFLQDGSHDNNKVGGNWFLANQEMLSALEFSGYECTNNWGEGGHDGKQTTAIFPEMMRWLWRDWPKPVVAGAASRQPLQEILWAGENWHDLGRVGSNDCLAAGINGEIFCTDASGSNIEKISSDGGRTNFVTDAGEVVALACTAKHELLVLDRNHQLTTYGEDGHAVAKPVSVDAEHLCAAKDGGIYLTEKAGHRVWHIDKNGRKVEASSIITAPSFLCLSLGENYLQVGNALGQFIYSFRVESDGSLTDGQPFDHLRLEDGQLEKESGGMAADIYGRLYAATSLGVQVFDDSGRVQGIISAPPGSILSNITFAGMNEHVLYACGGGQLFSRKLHTRGIEIVVATAAAPR